MISRGDIRKGAKSSAYIGKELKLSVLSHINAITLEGRN